SLSFRGRAGSVNRPFAGPGDPVELRLSPTCDAGKHFPDDPVVSVFFTPPHGPRSLVVVAADCGALAGALASCSPQTARVDCRQQAPQLADGRLVFSFPDTDDLIDAVDDDRTLTGAVRLAVTPAGAPLPCQLASTACGADANLAACIDTL